MSLIRVVPVRAGKNRAPRQRSILIFLRRPLATRSRETIRHTDPPFGSYSVGRASVRRVRIEHGSGPDEQARPALADGGHRLATGLAVDLRWGGLRLGRRSVDHR